MGLATAAFVLGGGRERKAVRIANAAMVRPGTRILMSDSSEMTPGEKRCPKRVLRVPQPARDMGSGRLPESGREVPGDQSRADRNYLCNSVTEDSWSNRARQVKR